MEFEIDDEPQGLPDQPDGDRDGGLRETLVTRREPLGERRAFSERHARIDQLGELA